MSIIHLQTNRGISTSAPILICIIIYLWIWWWLVIGQWRSRDLEIIWTISEGSSKKTIARYKWSCTAIVIFERNILNQIDWIEIRIWLIKYLFYFSNKMYLFVTSYFLGKFISTWILYENNLWVYFSICIRSSLFLDHIMTAIISKDIIKQILTDLAKE